MTTWADVEARIETELQTTKPFLVLERLSQAEQQKAAAILTSGAVFITQVPGPTLLGPKPKIPDGLVHHWLGVVRVPGVRVDDVLAFVQRYDDSPRYFKDAIASKLVQAQRGRVRGGPEAEAREVTCTTQSTRSTTPPIAWCIGGSIRLTRRAGA